MPKCAVRSCKNSSNNIRIRDGVSFFHYPRDPELAERWWNILSPVVSDSFKPQTAVVCSEHFQHTDKYMCKKRNRLTKNAIPDSHLLGSWRRPHTMPPPEDPADSDSSDDENTMFIDLPDILRAPSESTVCRLCLLSEGRMERVCEDLEEAYRQVTGIKWERGDRLPQHACWECAARLRGAAALRRRARAAHAALCDVRADHNELTLNDIMQIDRSYHSLTSNLSQKHFPPNEYLSKTINNNQIFAKDTKDYESNTKYIEFTLDDAKTERIENHTLTETRHFADIGNNAKNDTDVLINEENFAIENDNLKANNIKQETKESNTDKDCSASDFRSEISNIGIKNDDDQNVNGDEVVKTDAIEMDDDSRSDVLVIDAEEQALETVIKSEYVSKTDGGMPIDELIDIYNNDGDGDGRLQELNEQFEGFIVQVDQRWGGCRAGAGAEPPAQDQPRTKRRARSRRHEHRSKPRDQQTREEYCMSKAYEKLDRKLFRITPVTDEDQIAEVLKRQETYRYKRAPFKCELCYRGFQARRAHASHMLRHDEKNGAYECHICKARQKSPRAIKTHIYGQHTVRISCNQCSFVTMNRSVARSHQKWHAGTIYQCPYCPGRFDQESAFKNHLRTQHVHAHACCVCGLTYDSAKGLAVHRCKRHAGADKIPLEGPYCDTCEMRFASDDAHARHLNMSSRHRTDNVPQFVGLRAAGIPDHNNQPNATLQPNVAVAM